jgi:hypothetical protein
MIEGDKRSTSRLDDNNRKHLQEAGCRGIDWISVAEDRDWWGALNAIMNLGVL